VNYEEFIALRRAAGERINPETAEVWWDWVQMADPYEWYGAPGPPLAPEYQCVTCGVFVDVTGKARTDYDRSTTRFVPRPNQFRRSPGYLSPWSLMGTE
jgi:hypothetical protein